ncbi:MAG TPA: adenosylcobinamide-GDP ribazoletransferase [Bacteroidia bacterium]|jgi:adenosylcobinamide-GDP ribazoletransferase|nr:adenosylcobinamide-GDP ribazoletransferase [Bacteroidia bacterium]
MKKEIRIFFTAMMFYTRIPCPAWVDHSEEYLNKASRYFPLIGILVGAFSGLVFYGASFILPAPVCLILAMLAGVLMTGAFHEDGLADVCDGFGGGWTKQKILDIMKDSRVGAYGVIGLVFLFLMKFELLASIPSSQVPLVLIAAHALSRFTAITFVFTHTYARTDDSSKSKPVAERSSAFNLLLAGIFGIAPLLLLKNPLYFLILLPLFLMKAYLGRYFKKWIGGYTGDCLGAVQQISEVLFYLSYLVVWKYI